MDGGPEVFGAELRRRRLAAGLSLADLAAEVHYSKSYLSRVETGGKLPGPDLARRCDAALGCDGALARLLPRSVAGAAGGSGRDPGEVWVLSMDADGSVAFRVASRQDLPAADTGSAAAVRLPPDPPPEDYPPRDGDADLAPFRRVFDQLRAMGQRMAPAVVIPLVAAQTHALRTLARTLPDARRGEALLLAARVADYAGWMAQEAGDDTRALWWTDRAVGYASAGGDREMAAYALVRRALVTLYRSDSVQTVRLAQAAQAGSRDRRVRGLAAQREAQGHALAGEYGACHRALDRAAELLAAAGSEGGAPVIGTSHVPDPAAMATGWCLFDLGQPRRAAGVLRRGLDLIPAGADRARARYGARLALALAASGEIDEACATAQPVLDACGRVDSATIRRDLAAFNRTLSRWHTHPAARDTRLRLSAALHAPLG